MVMIYCGGYSLIHITARYVWIINILLLLMGSSLMSRAIKRFRIGKASQICLAIVFFGSFLILPRRELDLDRLRESDNKHLFELSKRLAKYDIYGNIASNDDWLRTLNLAYFMSDNGNLKYYGVPRNEGELREYNISHLFCWKGKEHSIEHMLSDSIPINQKYEDSEIVIYEIRWY